jgi:hypothetical protein
MRAARAVAGPRLAKLAGQSQPSERFPEEDRRTQDQNSPLSERAGICYDDAGTLSKGGRLAKSSRAYKSSKRSRELARQKKQEEKRLRRLSRHLNPSPDGAAPEPEQEPGQEAETGGETPGDETPEGGTPETN